MRYRDFNPPYNRVHKPAKSLKRAQGTPRETRHTGRFALRRTFSSLSAAYLTVVILVSAGAVHLLHVRSIAPRLPHSIAFASGKPKYLVLMVLDGGRPDYFGLTSLPHLDALRSEGTQFTNATLGILEAETPAGHATIATGSTPVHDGILGFDWAQNDNDFSLFSTNVVNAGAFDRIMESTHAPTIAGLYKARYPGAKVVALSGHKYYAAAPMGGPHADAIMYYEGDPKGRYVPVAIPAHQPPPGVLNAPGLTNPTTRLKDGQDDGFATKLALAAFAKMRQRITLINYPEFDWPLGHVYGSIANRAKVITDMKQLDRDLGKIEAVYRKAGILDQTLFVITADHGMDVTSRFVPQSVITSAVSQAATAAPAISYSTAAYVWVSDANKAKTVAENVMNARNADVQSVYYLTEVGGKPGYALAGGSSISAGVDSANQYLLGTLLNGHQPTVVAFAREGSTFADPKTGWKADHGGSGWQAQHIPLIMAGPGIQSGALVNSPAQLEDLAPTILTDMGVAPSGMQGSVLAEALQGATDGQTKVRSAEIKQISPVIHALQVQDRLEKSLTR